MHPRRTLEAASVTTHLRLRDTQWIRRATHPFGLEGFSSRSKKIKQPPKKGQFKLPPTIFSFQQMEQPVAGIGRWVMRLKLSDWSLLLHHLSLRKYFRPFGGFFSSLAWGLEHRDMSSNDAEACLLTTLACLLLQLAIQLKLHWMRKKRFSFSARKKVTKWRKILSFFGRTLEVIVTLAIASLRCCKTVKDQVMQTSDTSSKIESLRRVGCRS